MVGAGVHWRDVRREQEGDEFHITGITVLIISVVLLNHYLTQCSSIDKTMGNRMIRVLAPCKKHPEI